MKLKTRNLLTIFSALLFGLSVVSLSVMRVSRAEVMAQTGGEETVEVEIIGEKENNEEAIVVTEDDGAGNVEMPTIVKVSDNEKADYYLPYPGILPDHPLYWLKMIRDRVMLALTKNPVDRYGRLLLYADKRVGAAKVLIEGGKAELGVTTATKAEKYLEQAVEEFKAIDDPGMATPEERERLIKAGMKHEEALSMMLEKVPDQSRSALQEAIQKAKQLYQELEN